MVNALNGMFGKVAPGMCRLSMSGGIAVKTSNGYKSYNVKTGRLTNCDNFVFNIGEEFFFIIPTNKVEFVDRKIDDATNYETIKKVEDTCRSMITSYESDRLTYEQYKDSVNEEKQSWAEQAKMRANKTASSYNNYILKNSFVWNGNIPADIKMELPYLE